MPLDLSHAVRIDLVRTEHPGDSNTSRRPSISISGVAMSFRAYEGSSLQCAIWNPKRIRVPPSQRRVLVIHAEWIIGDSIALLLGLRGFSAELATDVFAARGCIAARDPHAIFLDTRVGAKKNYNFATELSASERATRRLLIAMSNFAPPESTDCLRTAGYDGHSRRPCPMWQIADLLDSFFETES
jgi:CheY-like chemotaxis protein